LGNEQTVFKFSLAGRWIYVSSDPTAMVTYKQ